MAPSKKQKSVAHTTPATTKRKKIRSFKLFNNLPIEVRWRIYEYASYTRRLIRANWHTRLFGDSSMTFYKLEAGPVPTVLHLDKEARREALNKYFYKVPSILSVHSWYPNSPYKRKYIYINEEDMIYFVTYCTTSGLLATIRKLAKHIPLTKLLFKADLMGKFISQRAHVLPSLPPKIGLPNAVLFDLVMEHPQLQTIDFVLDKSQFAENARPWTYQVFSFPRCSTPLAIFGSHRPPWYWETLGHVWRLAEETNCDGWRGRKKWEAFLEKCPEWMAPRLGVVGIRRCTRGVRDGFGR